MKRKQHFRLTGRSPGTLAVDLSGPHCPTPRPDAEISSDNDAHYFLAATFTCEVLVDPVLAEEESPSDPISSSHVVPLMDQEECVVVPLASHDMSHARLEGLDC